MIFLATISLTPDASTISPIVATAIASSVSNPANDNLMIDFEVVEKDNFELFVTNILGQKIKTLINGIGNSGPHADMFNIGELGTGIYYVILKTPSVIKTKKIIIIE